MRERPQRVSSAAPAETLEAGLLRRALLLIEREKTREVGRRKLQRLADMDCPEAPIAMCGLAESAIWSGDFREALRWSTEVVGRFSMSPAAIWCSTLLVSLYRKLGMKRERFEADQRRLRTIRQIAFQSENRSDRIYALGELLRELESRNLMTDARRCQEELETLAEAGDIRLDSYEIGR